MSNEMKNKEIPYKIYLSEDELPKQYYNVRADMRLKGYYKYLLLCPSNWNRYSAKNWSSRNLTTIHRS